MGFIKEFKEFAVKGNVMDMAVGVIIGGAFGKIVTSLVGDVLMPVISLATGGIDFTNLFVNLSDDVKYKTLAEAQEAGASVFAYGQFVQNVRLHHHRLLYLHDAQGYQQAQPQEGRARSRARGSRRTYPGRVAR